MYTTSSPSEYSFILITSFSLMSIGNTYSAINGKSPMNNLQPNIHTIPVITNSNVQNNMVLYYTTNFAFPHCKMHSQIELLMSQALDSRKKM